MSSDESESPLLVSQNAVQTRVELWRANTIAPSSRAAYDNSCARFLKWLAINRSSLMRTEFIEFFNENWSDAESRRNIKSYIQSAPSSPPIHFDIIESSDFLSWLAVLQTESGEDGPGYSACNIHRSALSHLLRSYNKTMQNTVTADLALNFRRIKRTLAHDRQFGIGDPKSGKDPLPFAFLKFLNQEMISKSNDFVFARCFLLLSWNLMCRSGNTFSITFNHMNWNEDALQIYFSQQKND